MLINRNIVNMTPLSLIIGIAIVLISCETVPTKTARIQLNNDLNARILTEQVDLRLIGEHLKDISPDLNAKIREDLKEISSVLDSLKSVIAALPTIDNVDKYRRQLDNISNEVESQSRAIAQLVNDLASARENL